MICWWQKPRHCAAQRGYSLLSMGHAAREMRVLAARLVRFESVRCRVVAPIRAGSGTAQSTPHFCDPRPSRRHERYSRGDSRTVSGRFPTVPIRPSSPSRLRPPTGSSADSSSTTSNRESEFGRLCSSPTAAVASVLAFSRSPRRRVRHRQVRSRRSERHYGRQLRRRTLSARHVVCCPDLRASRTDARPSASVRLARLRQVPTTRNSSRWILCSVTLPPGEV